MQSFTTTKVAKVLDFNGQVVVDSEQNQSLSVGLTLEPGAVLRLPVGAEVTLAFEDGSLQKVTAVDSEAENNLIVETLPNNIDFASLDNIQDDIEAIQALIQSGDDLDLPDTAAGGIQGNQGTDFVTLNRDGDELLAEAGYDTTEVSATTPENDDPELAQRSAQPTITQSDFNTIAEDTIATGNVLDNDSDLDDALTVQSFSIAGDATVYTAGQTAVVEGGTIVLNTDGSYTFTPSDNFNGLVPVVTYTTNTGSSDTLTIEVTPVSDLIDDNESVSTAEDTSVNGNLLTNASSADGTPAVTGFTVSGATYSVGDTASLTEGNLTINADGSYTFVPAANYNGAVPVATYTVEDGVNTDSSTLSIEVTPESDLTDADESVSTAEDTTVTGNVLTNASSADGTPAVTGFTLSGTTYSVGDTASITEGNLTINADGSYTFVPAANYNGAVPVATYTVEDGVNSDTSTLSIEVTPASDLTDANESVSTAEDTSVSGNVLTNASSADGTPVVTGFNVGGTNYSVGDTAALTEGNLTINANGTYTFAPAANFNGTVPVATYTLEDGVNSDSSTLSIEVTPASDLTDADESVTTAEDTNVSGNVLNNAASADGTPTVTGFTVGGTTYPVGSTAALTEGNLTINADGSYTFVPAANYNGAVPVATYTVEDGVNTDSSTLSIEVTPESDLTDADESVSTAEDTTVTGNVLTNASSADGTPAVTGFTLSGTTYSVGVTASITEGNLTINADGSYTFVPAANYNGAVPVATYTVEDGVNSDTSTLSIEVTPASDLTDANESVSTAEDTSVSGNVLTNASSADGTPIVTGFNVGGTNYSVGDTAALTEGNLTINANGTYTFAPAANFNGTVPVATYTLEDGVNSDSSTLSIEVTPASDLTDADESVNTAEDTTVNGNVLTNAASADGTPTVTGFTVGGTNYPVGSTANLTEGDLTINADGSYTFVPAANYNGAVPVATYTVEDGINSDSSTLSIGVTPASDLTDADESVNTAEDTTVNGNVLTNAASADGTPTVTGFTVGGTNYPVGSTANLTEGDLTINANGSYTFVPAANFNGAVPVATYTVEDGVNADTSTLTIAVTPGSDLTDADESVNTAEDTNVSGNVLNNAASADGTPVITGFTIAGSTATYAAGGTANLTEGDLTINADGSYTFVPAANFNGAVPVATYTVEDGVNSDNSTLSINVTPVSDLTDADESVSTAEDTTVTGSVLTNASSADGTPVITGFTIAGSTATYAAGGTANLTEGDLTINADGSYSFVPAANFNGTVPVATYTVEDGVNSDNSTLSINVTPVSDLTDANESVTTAEDTTITGNVLTNASSADGTPVVTGFTVGGTTYPVGSTANLTEGDLTINANGSYTFAPAANYNGPVPVATYTVEDGVNTDTSTLTIAVTPGSDLTDADESVTTAEDTTVNGNVLTNAASADGTPTVTGFTVGGTNYPVGSTANLTEGDLTINANGSYTFAPAANFNGTVPVATYTLEDGVNSDSSTLSIQVTPASDLTDADESVTTAEDTNVSGNVLTNAASADGTPTVTGFTVGGATYPIGSTANLTEGDLTINANGTYTFAPAANFNGTVPVATYTVEDGVNTDTSTLTIAVTPESDLTDADESVTTAEDTNVSGNVLSNAASADGTPVITGFTVAGSAATYAAGDTAVLTEGNLTINANGTYTFAPAANYNGSVPVATYTVSDGVNTDTSTLTIAVTPESDLTDANESVSTAEDTSVSGNVLTNASSADGTPVVTGFTVGGTTYPVGSTATLTEGDLTINANGTYTFAPAANYNGAVPVATYTVSDGVNTDTSTLTIAVTPESDLTDADESVTTAEDTNVSGNVLSNAASVDGTPVITGFTVAGSAATYAAGDTAVLTEGNLTINANGTYTFAPAANYNGSVPVATYTVSDGVNTDTSTLTIAVTPESDLTDANESVSTAEDTSVSGNVLTNASSADGTPVVTGFTVGGTTYPVGSTATLTEGDLTINANGTYTFAPAANYNGAVPVATYTVSDGVNTDTSTLTIAVTPESDLTDADESVTTAEDTNVSGNVLSNAASVDGTPVITGFTVAGSAATYAAGDTAVLTEGNLTINANGSYTFAPAANYNGPVPVATYTVEDGVNTDTSTLSIEVTPESDLTDADESVTTAEDITVNGNVLTNASSADGTPVVTGFTVGGTTYPVGSTANLTEGDLTINANGSYSFVPAANFNGTVPVATYTVEDGVNSDNSTLSINVTPVSDLTDANESVTTAEDTTITGNVLTNASSADGTPVVTGFTVGGTTYPVGSTANLTEGDLTINADGSYSFVPAANFNGTVPAATYTVEDGVNTDTSTLSIEVTAVNNPPVAVDDRYELNDGEAVKGNVITNSGGLDSDGGDGANLSITEIKIGSTTHSISSGQTITVPLGNGSLTIDSQGEFSYKNDGFVVGDDMPTFGYTLSDGTDTDTAQVTIEILDDGPTANNDYNEIDLIGRDTLNFYGIKGNVVSGNRKSSGDVLDVKDSDDLSAPTITQVVFHNEDGTKSTYTFNGTNSLEIPTPYGTLTIESSGYYTFKQNGATIQGGNNTHPDSLVFTYTIQDGDDSNPEEDSADLTINITAPPIQPSTQSNDIDIDFDAMSGTIDTDLATASVAEPDDSAFVYATDKDGDGLNDILIDSNTEGLESYLAILGADQNAGLSENDKEQPVNDKVTLEKNQDDSAQLLSTKVTNSLLADGAIIVSDAVANPSSASIAELDSPELL